MKGSVAIMSATAGEYSHARPHGKTMERPEVFLMKDAAISPLQPSIVPFSEFLAALIQALNREGVRPCVLRNYEGFPENNAGNDVDFLIHQRDLPRAMRALRSIESIRLVNYSELSFIASVFLEGTSATSGSRFLQVDFFWSLCFRGLPYISTDTVLQAETPRRAGNLSFFVPSSVHEAIITLCTSLIHSAYLKEKYLPKVQRMFASERHEVIAALSPQFGLKASTRLVDSVIDGDRQRIRGCIRPLRIALGLRSLLHTPFRSTLVIVRYYEGQFRYLFSPKSIETVCILGPSGCGKTRLIERLAPKLQSSAKVIEKRQLGRRSVSGRASRGNAAGTEYRAKGTGGPFASMVMIVAWLVEEWLDLVVGRKILTIRIYDRYYHDLLIDPQRYRYGGPMWFARLVGKLFPSPGLWILLDPTAEGLQTGSKNVSAAETRTQPEAYRAFVQTRKNYVIVDATQPAEQATECAYRAIVDTLARRADRRLKHLL